MQREIEERFRIRLEERGVHSPRSLSLRDLEYLLSLYDVFLEGSLSLSRLSLALEESHPRFAASCSHKPPRITLFRATFDDLFSRNSVEWAGRPCYNFAQCIAATLEHELVHFLIGMFFPSQRRISHGRLFASIASVLFGHEGYVSWLGYAVDGSERRKGWLRETLRVGMRVVVAEASSREEVWSIKEVRGEKIVVERKGIERRIEILLVRDRRCEWIAGGRRCIDRTLSAFCERHCTILE
jgi:hypothetical protein